MDEDERNELFEQTNIAGAVGQVAQSNAAAQYYLEEAQKSLAETQLEVESITTKCYHLLKQDVLSPNEKGEFNWQSIKDSNERVLTDTGVDKFMTLIHFYINKSNLLSNFDEKQINTMMYRFVTELNDLVLLKYQVLFKQSSFEDCKKILMERIEDQKNARMFATEIATGKKPDAQKVKDEIIKETESKIEYEIKKIRDEQRREKLREYGIIMAQLETIVFAALNRAWKGEERGSIRRHTNISEILGGRPQMQKGEQGGMFSKWGR